jgi:hypothetical protein
MRAGSAVGSSSSALAELASSATASQASIIPRFSSTTKSSQDSRSHGFQTPRLLRGLSAYAQSTFVAPQNRNNRYNRKKRNKSPKEPKAPDSRIGQGASQWVSYLRNRGGIAD